MTTIAINGRQVSLVDQGSGPPLLFVHGFPLNRQMWDAQVEHFSRSGFRCIAPDLRGLGESDVSPGTVSMQRFAEDLAEVLAALSVSEPVWLCGLSMGGYIAWEFFVHSRPKLAGLILCDTRAAADSREAAKNRLNVADQVVCNGTGQLAEGMLGKLLASTTLEHQPQVVEAVRNAILTANPEGVAAAQRGMAERRDATSLLAKIDLPTLLVCGESDPISTVEEMREMSEAISGSAFQVIPEAAHLPNLENPEAFHACLGDFLADLG